MVIYSGAGTITTNNTIYDINSGTIWNINSSGKITTVKSNC